MQILAFQGSPRIGGNTDMLLSAFLSGAKEAGAVVEKYDLYRLEFSPCIECGGCDRTGECVLEDDLTPVYPKFFEVDVIVVASPIFFYNISARTQALIERAQACWIQRYVLKKENPKKRYGTFLSLGATKGRKLFEGVQRTVRYFFDALGVDYQGGLFYRGIEKRGAIKEHPTALKEAYQLGLSVGRGEEPSSWPLVRDPSP